MSILSTNPSLTLQSQNSISSKYEQIQLIGKGSFGVVKKVSRLADNKILVWKQMNYSNMSSRQKQQLVTEVNVLKQLSHPNIVKYYDRLIDQKSRKVFIVMEYCSGGDLASYLKQLKSKKQFIPEDIIWKFIYQVIIALDQCHKKKIMHRDIKPANIFIDYNQIELSTLKLGDFGLSRQLGEHSEFAQTNVGTPYYMSPEQIKQSKYNQKSDIWSAGCIFYEIASLRRPFQATNQLALAQKISKGKFDRIPMKYSQDLQKLIQNMIMIDPERRLSTEQILSLPYLLIREEQKQRKKKITLIRDRQEQLINKKIRLMEQLRILEQKEKHVQIPNKYFMGVNNKKSTSYLRQREDYNNKQNNRNFGNLTDR